MRFFVIAVALFAFLAGGTNEAAAACKAICQAKCQQNPGAHSVEACILKWSCMNEKYGRAAPQFAGLHGLELQECGGLADLSPALQRYFQR
jgi:hypothetical protein